MSLLLREQCNTFGDMFGFPSFGERAAELLLESSGDRLRMLLSYNAQNFLLPHSPIMKNINDLDNKKSCSKPLRDRSPLVSLFSHGSCFFTSSLPWQLQNSIFKTFSLWHIQDHSGFLSCTREDLPSISASHPMPRKGRYARVSMASRKLCTLPWASMSLGLAAQIQVSSLESLKIVPSIF